MKKIERYWLAFPILWVGEIVLCLLQMFIPMLVCTGFIWLGLLAAWQHETGLYTAYFKKTYPDAYVYTLKNGNFALQMAFTPKVKDQVLEEKKRRVAQFEKLVWIAAILSALPWLGMIILPRI